MFSTMKELWESNSKSFLHNFLQLSPAGAQCVDGGGGGFAVPFSSPPHPISQLITEVFQQDDFALVSQFSPCLRHLYQIYNGFMFYRTSVKGQII